MKSSDLVDVEGEIRAETDKAYQFYDGSVTVWLAKSQVEWDEQESTMTLPFWLAKQERLI
jgi:hypothetical protein